MSKRTNEIVRYALSYLLSNLGDALDCCGGSDIENMTEAEIQALYDSYDTERKVVVTCGDDGIYVPSCPVGVTVQITESIDEYSHTSVYDHTGRLD